MHSSRVALVLVVVGCAATSTPTNTPRTEERFVVRLAGPDSIGDMTAFWSSVRRTDSFTRITTGETHETRSTAACRGVAVVTAVAGDEPAASALDFRVEQSLERVGGVNRVLVAVGQVISLTDDDALVDGSRARPEVRDWIHETGLHALLGAQMLAPDQPQAIGSSWALDARELLRQDSRRTPNVDYSGAQLMGSMRLVAIDERGMVLAGDIRAHGLHARGDDMTRASESGTLHIGMDLRIRERSSVLSVRMRAHAPVHIVEEDGSVTKWDHRSDVSRTSARRELRN